MTTLAVQRHPAQAARVPRVPWRNFVWVIWSQHRFALAGAALLLAGLSAWMLINGLLIRSAIDDLGLNHCLRVATSSCSGPLALFRSEGYGNTAHTFTGVLQAVPALLGIFVGGPLLARELETGTFRFAWTQGCGRVRWTIAKLLVLAVVVTAGAGAFSLVISWYVSPFIELGIVNAFQPTLFDLRGVDFAAWTLAAFAIATLAGLVLRRTVPAMAAAGAAWAGLLLLTTLYARARYEAPIIGRGFFPARGRAWVLNRWWDGPGGHVLSRQAMYGVITRMMSSGVRSAAVLAALFRRGYTSWASYQPVSRFWHFQLIEGGWLLVLAVLLGAATVLLVRRAG